MERSTVGLKLGLAVCTSIAIVCCAAVATAQDEALPAASLHFANETAAVPDADAPHLSKEASGSQPADGRTPRSGGESVANMAMLPRPNSHSDASAAPATDASDSELIEERYPNRVVKIERHVVQDADANYVNHGQWTMFDEKGRMLTCGAYYYGERHGLWTRWFLDGPRDMFAQAPYKQFEAPFVAEASFDAGRLSGKSAVYDRQDRKCSEFSYKDGERHGKSVWYYPNGERMREIDFNAGQVDGLWQEWAADKTIAKYENYHNGRRLTNKVERYADGQLKSETMSLVAGETLKDDDDLWDAALPVATTYEGPDVRHGLATTWYKNGQKEKEGRYDNDVPVGKLTWWYENGQKMLEGQFDDGNRAGVWTWWHENGQKRVRGEFGHNAETGKWFWWQADGKVAISVDYSGGQSNVAATPAPTELMAITPPAPPNAKPAIKQPRGSRNGQAAPMHRH